MAYDEALDARISEAVAPWDTTRKKMFGGTCYLLNGNMMAGVYKNSLILRLGEEKAAQALGDPVVRPFDITGRIMKGWVMVEPEGTQDDELAQWLSFAKEFVDTLPPKKR